VKAIQDQANSTEAGVNEHHPVSPTDEQLVAGAQEGDKQASDELVRRYMGKAYAIAYHMCSGDKQDAEDLTQEAFLRALGNINKFRGRSYFYNWLYRILVNTCLDGRRRRQRWKKVFSLFRGREEEIHGGEEVREPSGPVEVADPSSSLNARQLAGAVGDAVANLPQRQRTAFQLEILHGMSIAEVARVMGLAEGTAKTHLFRAMHAVREAADDWL
jgi:RNA polymerase sigma-70 factor (ECF subfamily)